MDEDEVVIVGADGVEHVFPPGFNPKRAAAIVRGGSPTLPTRPVSAEDFAPAPRGLTATLGELAKGFGKGAARSAIGIGEMAVNAGLTGRTPSMFMPEMRHPGFQRLDEMTAYDNDLQNVGGNIETVAELAAPARGIVKAGVAAVPAIARKVGALGPVAFDAATHVIPGGRYIRGGRRLLAAVLDASKSGQPVADDILAGVKNPSSYEEWLATKMAEKPADLIPAVEGRLVKAKAPSLETMLADELASGEPTMPPARITTPPPAQLPAGYSPRTSVPKPKPAKMAAPAPEPTPEPAAPPKRAYFLKSPEQMAIEKAAKAEMQGARIEPSGSLTIDDLPASWRPRAGQDIFPTTGAEGKEIAAAFQAEMKARGMSVGEAITAVSRNRDIPTAIRSQLIRALSKSGSR